jgi:hypothetical protein
MENRGGTITEENSIRPTAEPSSSKKEREKGMMNSALRNIIVRN